MHTIMTAVYPGSEVCPCCNHYFKNVGKHLRKCVASKLFGKTDRCDCYGKTHVRTATGGRALCGCPTLLNASKVVSWLHAAKAHAGPDPVLFEDRVRQYIAHMGGDHSTCDFHSKTRCTGDSCDGVIHRGWRCTCGKCTDKQRCWGEAVELPAECKSQVPWTSRNNTTIACRGHFVAFEAKLLEVGQRPGLRTTPHPTASKELTLY